MSWAEFSTQSPGWGYQLLKSKWLVLEIKVVSTTNVAVLRVNGVPKVSLDYDAYKCASIDMVYSKNQDTDVLSKIKILRTVFFV